MKIPQKSRILDLLIERGGLGVFGYELAGPRPNGLGCLQYGARILELRRKGYNIRNDRLGHFYLHTEPVQIPFQYV